MFTGLADAGADCDEASDTPWPEARLLRPQRDPLGQAEAQAGRMKRAAAGISVEILSLPQLSKSAQTPLLTFG
jgi:hypothetical protein